MFWDETSRCGEEEAYKLCELSKLKQEVSSLLVMGLHAQGSIIGLYTRLYFVKSCIEFPLTSL